jgi:hypothetical protein
MTVKTATKMNTIFTRSLLAGSLLGGLAVPLQRAAAQSDRDLIEVARTVITADRKTVVLAAMELTDNEAKDFWPLYREYRSAMDEITDDRMKLVLDYANVYPNIPDAKATEMLKTYTELQERQVQKRNAYLKKFAKVLPPAKALRFAQIETRLDLLVYLNLAARIPITPLPAAPATAPTAATDDGTQSK